MNNLVDHYINNFDPVTDIKAKKERNSDARRADRAVKHCIRCNKCWEYNGNIKSLAHYEDFPTYKRKRETCIICLKRQGAHAR